MRPPITFRPLFAAQQPWKSGGPFQLPAVSPIHKIKIGLLVVDHYDHVFINMPWPLEDREPIKLSSHCMPSCYWRLSRLSIFAKT